MTVPCIEIFVLSCLVFEVESSFTFSIFSSIAIFPRYPERSSIISYSSSIEKKEDFLSNFISWVLNPFFFITSVSLFADAILKSPFSPLNSSLPDSLTSIVTLEIDFPFSSIIS